MAQACVHFHIMKTTANRPRQIFMPDPLLGWRLSANQRLEVRFRPEIDHTTGPEGWRTVPGQPEHYQTAIGFYGCSYTYGTALDDGETFTSLLQKRFPESLVLNRGVGGHGSVQSYLQFREDVDSGRVSAGVFCVIGDHKYRNMPHPLRMKAFLTPDWYRIGVEHHPYATTRAGGGVDVHYLPIWQPVLKQHGLNPFLPDEIMLNRLTLDVFREVHTCANGAGVPIRIVLLDRMDPDFNRLLLGAFDNATDISTPHDAEHRFLPQDLHPNVHANQLYAERLLPVVEPLMNKAALR